MTAPGRARPGLRGLPVEGAKMTPTEPAPILVEGLTKRYGATDAVHDLSFAVVPGRVTGFLGPNGSGKTTTMRAVLGLIAPTAGRALVHGRPYRALDDPVRQVGALIDGTQSHPAMTGRRGLQVRAAASGIADSRVDEVLDMVGLAGAADRRVGGYSLGMRQRLGLAGALLGDPGVLVLDEPANGLDPDGVRWIRELLRYLADQGRTVFVSSHMLAEVARMADEVVVIDRGRFVTHTPVTELTVDHHVLVRTPDAHRFEQVLAAHGATVADEDGALAVVGLSIEEVGRLASRGGVELHELRQRDTDLEAAFFDLVRTDTEA
jgi:ABC-2 type transport system ATP-binding protein